MANVILKCRYLRAGHSAHSQNLVKYIATREGVEKLDDAWKAKPVSKAQQELVEELLRDFPEAKNSYEYQDLLNTPTQGNASAFISMTLEENADRIDKKDNYVHYIANRPHVEKLGTHGLFTGTDAPFDLDEVADTVAQHPGIVWTNVLSLRREDASRLGYEKAESWIRLLRKQAPAMAKAMKIPLQDLRWYAAFHNEGNHPHCHIVAYSAGKEPYMSDKAILDLKAAFSREMFRQDRIQIYEKQTKHRDDLMVEARQIVAAIVSQINAGTYQNKQVEELMQELSKRLANTTGKKMYGYLPQNTRNLVNGIVDELAKDPKIAALYDLWYEQQCQIVQFYQDADPEKLPLSQNKVFKPIRNAVVQEALNLNDETLTHTDKIIPDDLWSGLPEETDEDVAPVSQADPSRPVPPPSPPPPPQASEPEEPKVTVRVRHSNRRSPAGIAGARLAFTLGRIIEDEIQEDNKKVTLIDRKLRRQIEEKKQAHGLRMG